MRDCEIREAAKQLMQQAGIDDNRPYHIKHAAITWLKKQRTAPDTIVRFSRHAPASSTYMDYYLSEDFGATCSQIIERTAIRDDATSNSASETAEGEEEQEESQEKRTTLLRKRVRRTSN
jgi:hypothetical protein